MALLSSVKSVTWRSRVGCPNHQSGGGTPARAISAAAQQFYFFFLLFNLSSVSTHRCIQCDFASSPPTVIWGSTRKMQTTGGASNAMAKVVFGHQGCIRWPPFSPQPNLSSLSPSQTPRASSYAATHLFLCLVLCPRLWRPNLQRTISTPG